MREKRRSEGRIKKMQVRLGLSSWFNPFFYVILMALFAGSCTKDDNEPNLETDPLSVAGITQVIPVNLADSVEVNPVLSVAFKQGTDPSKVSETTIILKKGSNSVPGKTTIAGTTATFKPETDLAPETEYIATVTTSPAGGASETRLNEYSWRFKTGHHHHNQLLSILSTDPVDNAKSVPVTAILTVTFNQELTTLLRNSTAVILKNGVSSIQGKLSFSGSKAVFKPSSSLEPNTVYSAKVKMGTGYHFNDDKSSDSFSWSFTTTGGGTDVTAPKVSSVSPLNNALSVPAGSTYSVTFSEQMNPSTITSSTITVKQGTTPVAGKVTYSGVKATFTPDAPFSSNTAYTGTVTTDAKDVAGNSLAAAFTSVFTTVATGSDVTAPTAVSVSPQSNATAVAVNTKPAVTFSEAMSSSSITTTTFTLKQGATSVAGTVSYSGTTATFTPSAALTGNTVYTGTITTGAKDAAGNSIAANYTWNFTTVATVSALSFASDVMPVLTKCNTCHTHGWTTSGVASTFYTNLVNSGYVNPSSPTTSKIYTKLNGGHPGSTVTTAEVNKILNWMTEGSKNN
jgi:hypothetical protein